MFPEDLLECNEYFPDLFLARREIRSVLNVFNQLH